MPPRRRNPARRRPNAPSAQAVEAGVEAAAGELRLDIHKLFSHYNTLYFNDSLSCCAVSWSSSTRNKELRSGISISPEAPESNYEKSNSNAEEKCDKTEDMKKRLPSRVGARKQKLLDKGQKATHTEEKTSLKKYFKSSGEVAQASLDISFDRHESQAQNKSGELENIESQMGKSVAKKVPKRQRTSNRKHVSTPSKRRKQGTSENGCTVIIPSLGYYETEEDDDSEPLLNKRSERRKKKKLLDSLLRQSAQTAATDGKTLALIGASGNGGDQDVDSSVIHTEGCHSTPPSELVKDAHEARLCLFQIENKLIHAEDPYDEKPPSMKHASLPCPADDENVELGAFEDESSDVRLQNGLRKSTTPPNSPDFVYISDD